MSVSGPGTGSWHDRLLVGHSHQPGGGSERMEEQRSWWRLATRAEQFQLTSQDKIILKHGLDIIHCSGVTGSSWASPWSWPPPSWLVGRARRWGPGLSSTTEPVSTQLLSWREARLWGESVIFLSSLFIILDYNYQAAKCLTLEFFSQHMRKMVWHSQKRQLGAKIEIYWVMAPRSRTMRIITKNWTELVCYIERHFHD